ncbi:MAG: prolipoprotein diacylglyceryl transferase [Bacteroidales bacterium]|nr:prolipoprotein diacylglyceryl transferase [Bacteroidales bacterium]
MFDLLFIHWNVDPIFFHIGSFPVRWYSMGFLLAFVLGYYIVYRMFKREKVDTDYLDSMIIYIFLATLIGARLGHCLFYQPDYFLTSEHWLEIILPFDMTTGKFTGYEGLASHGAAIGILIALWLYYRRYGMNPIWFVDRLVIVVALGGAFIRLGNLMNSEIYGVETTMPWGFYFERNGETVPKHPTQIYESLSYFIIFIVCYLVYLHRDGKLRAGVMFGWWLIALFGVRFLIEYVKEEQVAFEQGMFLDMGQILSIPFIVLGIVMVVLGYKEKFPQTPLIEKRVKEIEAQKKQKAKKK